MAEGLRFSRKPEGYEPPKWEDVEELAKHLRLQRQSYFDRVWTYKQALRGDWDDVLRKIPRTYRKVQPDVDFPEIRDMKNRVAGIIGKGGPNVEVTPPSGRSEDVRKAAGEEARLHALRITIGDQQNRDPFLMGVDGQVSWGESWLAMWPDPSYLQAEGYQRSKAQEGADYSKSYKATMLREGVPLMIDDYDPQTVLPLRGSNGHLLAVIVETEHAPIDLKLALGYKPVKNQTTGKTISWQKTGMILSEGYVAHDATGGVAKVVDTTHAGVSDTPSTGSTEKAIKSTIYCDEWSYQRYLDDVLVEEWQHDWGFVPIFPAGGEQSSDRDPAWQNFAIIDAPLRLAKQIVYLSAVMAANAMIHGWPTPFIKNPESGLIHPVTLQPLSRQIKLGEVNVLGPQEDIVFPYLEAKLMPDFYHYMDYLTSSFEGSSLSQFTKQLGADASGYMVAQIRAMQLSILAPAYTNAARQWRGLFAWARFLVKEYFPGGIYLRGAVEVEEVDGVEVQYRPVMEYAKDDVTDFAINVHIDEGIVQDQLAERKSALEMMQSGVWSPRRVMEQTGVENPAAELDEIAVYRLLSSPAADQQKLLMAMAMVAERYQATRTDMSSPFMQALLAAQQQLSGGGGDTQPPGPSQHAGAFGPGNFENQPGEPLNAQAGGKPVQQQPPIAAPQQGAKAPPLQQMGVPGIPGGVKGGQGLGVTQHG
jgi:hypothetical protein